MTVTRVNSASIGAFSAAATAYTAAVPVGTGIAAGDLIVVVAAGNFTGTRVSDGMSIYDSVNGAGKPYNTIGETQQGGSSSHWMQTFYYVTPVNIADGSTFTFTPASGSTANSFSVDIYRGSTGSIVVSMVGQSNAANTSLAAPALASVPPAGSLVLTFCASSGGLLTTGSPFTAGSNVNNSGQSTGIGYVLSANGSSSYGSAWTDSSTQTSATQTVAFGGTASGAAYLVGEGAFASGTTSTVVSVSHATTVGDALVVVAATGSASVTPGPVTDTKANSYALVGQYQGSNGMCSYVFAAYNSAAALTTADTISVTWSSTSNNKSVVAVGCPGLATSAALDADQGAAGTSNAPSVSSGALAASGELGLSIIVGGSAAGSVAFGSGWGQIGSTQHTGTGIYLGVAARALSGSGSVTASATLGASAVWSAQVATFKAAAGGASVTVTTASPLPGGTVGQPYSETLAASGGAQPYTWALSGGSLPAGLSLSTGGGGGGASSIALAGAVAGPDGYAGGAYSGIGGGQDWVSMEGAIGPGVLAVKIFFSGDLPANVWTAVGSVNSGAVPPATGYSAAQIDAAFPGVVPIFCWNGPGGGSSTQPSSAQTIAAACVNIPAGRTCGFNWAGEPENPTSPFTTGASYVAGFQQTATALHALNRPELLAVTCSTWGQYMPTGRAVDGSFLPSGDYVDVYGIDIYQHQLGGTMNGATTWPSAGLSNYSCWLKWISLVVPLATPQGRAIAITEYGVDNTVSVSQRASRLQSDFTYLKSAFGSSGSVYSQALWVWLYWYHNMAATNAQYRFTDSAALNTWQAVVAYAGGTGGASTGGVISGTPTAAVAASFSVVATDANGVASAATPLSLTISVSGSLAIATTSLPGATVNYAYTAPLSASGGTSPYTWSVSAGSLPTGLTLDAAAGVISGSPTVTGTSSFTIAVTDSASPTPATATAALSITVAVLPAVTTTSLPAAAIGNTYTAALAASGGTSPYSWALAATSPDVLPAGLTLDPTTGIISGTPTTAGSFSLAFTVTDDAGATATSGNLTLAISSGSPLPAIGRMLFLGDAASWGWQGGAADAVLFTPGATWAFYDAATGGAQYTDLLSYPGGSPVSSVTLDSSGYPPQIQGPAGVGYMWVDANNGLGPRRLITATNLMDVITVLHTYLQRLTG